MASENQRPRMRPDIKRTVEKQTAPAQTFVKITMTEVTKNALKRACLPEGDGKELTYKQLHMKLYQQAGIEVDPRDLADK